VRPFADLMAKVKSPRSNRQGSQNSILVLSDGGNDRIISATERLSDATAWTSSTTIADIPHRARVCGNRLSLMGRQV
jgi:hypothetical protein